MNTEAEHHRGRGWLRRKPKRDEPALPQQAARPPSAEAFSKPAGHNRFDLEKPSSEYMALPFDIEAGTWPSLFRRTIGVVAIALGALLTIGALAPIRELALAEGQLVPERATISVQHLEGGIVGQVLVKPGAIVAESELLFRMQPTVARSDLEQIEARHASLSATKARLEALLFGQEPDRAEALARAGDGAARDQYALFLAERAALHTALEISNSRVAQKRSEVAATEKELEAQARQIAAQLARLDMRKELFANGLTSRSALIDAQVSLEQARAREAQLRGQAEGAKGAIVEIVRAYEDLESSRRVNWASELSKVTAEMAETEQTLLKLRDRLSRVEVRAPARGIIQSILPRVPGDVLKPGETAVEIVPMAASLTAEVRIKPDDVGYVRPGRPARVKATAFDPEYFGAIDAVVTSVSPTTFRSEKGEPYFIANLTLARTHLSRRTDTHELLPGMVVRAEIVTGERSVLRYLLKPIYRSINLALSER